MKENMLDNSKFSSRTQVTKDERKIIAGYEININSIGVAQKILQRELHIPLTNDKELMKKKVSAIIESSIFFEKLRINKLVRNALKVIIVTFSLIRAESAFSQTQLDSIIDKRDDTKLSQKKSTSEINRSLITESEYIVPEKVMIAFGEIVDPGMIGTPAGGYFKRNFLDSQGKQDLFYKKLVYFGYIQKDVERFKSYFQDGNIVFSENELEKEHFSDILVHERLHKGIDNLSKKDKKVLNEARNFILNDFRQKEIQWSNDTDSLFVLLQEGKISQQEYEIKSKEVVLKTNPILLDTEGTTSGLIPVLRNNEEFYTYLMMNKFQSQVIDYVKNNFPNSYKIFEELKNKIQYQIQKKK